MAINAKILLDPKFYYQKLKELASKTKSSAQQVSDDVKKAGKSALSELKGDNITPGSLMKRIFLGGGALAIIQKGIQSVFNLFDAWMKNKKAEIIDMLNSFDDVGHQYDRFDKQPQDKSSANQSALSTLSGLQMSDTPLNNVQKEQQRQAIETLRKSYRGLKIDVDAATGKIKNFEDVQSQVLSGDQKKELDLVQRQIRNIEKQNGVASDAVQYKGGAFSEYWAKLKETYGWGAAQEAGGVQKKNVDKLMDLRMREYQLKHSDRAADATAMYQAQMADRFDRLADPEASAAKKFALDEQIGETEKRLAALKAPKVGVPADASEVAKMEERLAALKKQREAMPKTKREQYEDSEKDQTQYLRLISEGRKEEAELLKFINDRKKEGIAYTEEQARAFLEERKNIATAQYYREATDALDDQLKIQRLLVQGKTEEAERQKIINELRKSGKTVDEAKVDELMKKKGELGSLNLQKSQKQEFESLYDKALRAAGRGKEADQTAALKRARESKGSDLTDAERDTTLKLAAVTEKLNNLGQGPNLGDMSIKTNSLTSRGGFSEGAVVTSKDRINLAIQSNTKAAAESQKKIEDLLKDFLKG